LGVKFNTTDLTWSLSDKKSRTHSKVSKMH
jgi:hypothetical protein